MALAVRVISRADMPHLTTLAGTLAPLLSVGNAGSFHLRWTGSAVVIEQAHFIGVNTASVDAAVLAAPSHTPALEAKAEIDAWPKPLKALTRLIAVELNRLRQNPTTVYPALTEAQVIAAIKTEIDGL
jgi:predicted trehalose synthase